MDVMTRARDPVPIGRKAGSRADQSTRVCTVLPHAGQPHQPRERIEAKPPITPAPMRAVRA